MSNSNPISKSSHPILPPLYLNEKKDEQVTTLNINAKDGVSKNNKTELNILECLPSELAMQCLVGYSSWGTIAKLSTVKKSYQNLLRDAASYGKTETKWEIAQALLDGTHELQKNPSQAVKYLHELALGSKTENIVETCFAPAMRKLGMCYLEGNGVTKDLTKGIDWMEQAFKEGNDVDAAHQLALMYEYSLFGVESDVVKAADWFHIAAKNGHVEAMAEYALCCELGCGRPQCDAEALEWYTRAANNGHVQANFSVGEAFEEAKGVPQSDEEAVIWYYKAAVMGDEDSKKALQRLQDIARIILPGWRDVLVLRD